MQLVNKYMAAQEPAETKRKRLDLLLALARTIKKEGRDHDLTEAGIHAEYSRQMLLHKQRQREQAAKPPCVPLFAASGVRGAEQEEKREEADKKKKYKRHAATKRGAPMAEHAHPLKRRRGCGGSCLATVAKLHLRLQANPAERENAELRRRLAASEAEKARLVNQIQEQTWRHDAKVAELHAADVLVHFASGSAPAPSPVFARRAQ